MGSVKTQQPSKPAPVVQPAQEFDMAAVKAQVARLKKKGLSDAKIAEWLRAHGVRNSRGGFYKAKSIYALRQEDMDLSATIKSTATHREEIISRAAELRKQDLTYQQVSDQLWQEGYGIRNGHPFSPGQTRGLAIDGQRRQ